MIWIAFAYVFWLALNGRLATYAGFVTTSNPAGGIGSIFKNFSIPITIGTDSGGNSTFSQMQGKNANTQGQPSQSGQPMSDTGSTNDVMSANPPGTYKNFLGNTTASQDNGIMSASAPSLAYLKEAQGNVSGGAAGL